MRECRIENMLPREGVRLFVVGRLIIDKTEALDENMRRRMTSKINK